MVRTIKITAVLISVITIFLIAYGSLSANVFVPEKYHLDKFIHGSAYSALAFLSFFFISKRKYLVAFLLILVFMGGGIEILQTLIPPRDGTIGDFAADTAGVIFGSLLAKKLKPIILGWFKK